MRSFAVASLLLLGAVLAGCTDDGGGDDCPDGPEACPTEPSEEPREGGGSRLPTTSPTTVRGGGGGPGSGADGPAALQLAAGTFWTFYWEHQESFYAQGASPSDSQASGRFTVTLGDAKTIDGIRGHPVTIDGETGNDDVDLRPRWTYLGVAGSRLLGSTTGTSWETAFDLGGNEFTGGGFFTDLGDAHVVATPGRLDNAFVSTETLRAGSADDQPMCTYYPYGDVGTVCGDTASSRASAEHFKPGIGPVGYHGSYSYTDEGGGFYTSYSLVTDVGLVATSLVGSDGWTPPPPAWAEVASMPTPRGHVALAETGGKIYTIGGAPKDGQASAVVEVFDVATGAWRTAASLPEARGDATAFVADGRIFVLGGSTTGRGEGPLDVFVYDPTADSWTRGTAASDECGDIGAMHVDVASGPDVVVVCVSGLYDAGAVRLFDSTSHAWAEGSASQSLGWSLYATASDADFMYLVGGWDFEYGTFGDKPHHVANIIRYDVFANTWERAWGFLTEPRSEAAAAIVGDTMFVFGGIDASGSVRSVESVDLLTGRSSAVGSMLEVPWGVKAITVGGKVYAFGTSSDDGPVRGLALVLDPGAL